MERHTITSVKDELQSLAKSAHLLIITGADLEFLKLFAKSIMSPKVPWFFLSDAIPANGVSSATEAANVSVTLGERSRFIADAAKVPAAAKVWYGKADNISSLVLSRMKLLIGKSKFRLVLVWVQPPFPSAKTSFSVSNVTNEKKPIGRLMGLVATANAAGIGLREGDLQLPELEIKAYELLVAREVLTANTSAPSDEPASQNSQGGTYAK